MKELLTKYRWPLLIALVAIVARLVYLLEISQEAGFASPMVDEKWHWEWAQTILQGPFWGEGAWFRAPLYPYFLALLSALSGGSVLGAKLLQVLLSGGTAWFIYRTAKHLFDRPIAVAAGFIYALYGVFIFYEAMFLIPVLFVFLLTWAMSRLIIGADSDSWQYWIVTGLLFGLATIARPNILLVMPFLMWWLFLRTNKERGNIGRARLPLMLALGVILCVAPVTLRNAVVTGEFMLISSQGGINLYLGNNENADGLTMMMPEVDLDESVSWRRFQTVTSEVAESEAGRKLTDAEQSSFWTGKALSFISNNPGQFLDLVWRKTVFLLSGFENSDNTDIYYQRNRSSIYSFLVWHFGIYFPFGLLLPLAVIGIYLGWDRRRDLWPVYVFMLAYVPSIVLFLVTARHRLPLVPFLIILAAFGLLTMVRRWSKLATAQKAIAVTLFVVCLLVFNQSWFDQHLTRGAFQIHLNNGIQYDNLDDYESAEREYLAADAAYPFSSTLINNLAHAQFQLGKVEEARENYLRALELDPDHSRALNNLGLVLVRQEQIDSAVVLFQRSVKSYDGSNADPEEVAQAWMNLADAWDRAHNLDSVAAAYEMAMRTAPEWSRPYADAAAFYARHEGYKRADSLYREAVDAGTLLASDAFNWGLALINGGRPHNGRALMHRALTLDGTLSEANYCIAIAHRIEGAPKDSVLFYLERCLDQNPDYEPAKQVWEEITKE